MSAAAAPGLVLFEGLLEGPTAAWDPDPAALADALGARGLPRDLFEVVIEGGRAALQPRGHAYPRAQFPADPAEALAVALQDLLAERPGAVREWFSSLRVSSFGETERLDALLQLSAEGLHLLRRSQPWSPPPAAPAWRRLARRWPIYAVALLALLAIAWLRREELLAGWEKYSGALFGD